MAVALARAADNGPPPLPPSLAPWQIVPTQEEQRALLRRAVRHGQIVDKAAFDELIERNQALVVSIAKRYLQRCKTLTLEDLVNIGFSGLRTAILRFDKSRSEALSTCATWWIRQRIVRGIEEEDAMVRLPTHMHTKLRERTWLHEVPLEDAADDGQPQSQPVKTRGRKSARDKQMLATAWQTRDVASLDEPLTPTSTDSLADVLPDPSAGFEDEVIERIDRQVMLDRIIGQAGLTVREAFVVAYRMGIAAGADGCAQSLEQIGSRLGVTRERIRQIELGAMRKLRKAAREAGYQGEMQLMVRPEHTKTKVGVARVKRTYTKKTVQVAV